MNRRILALALSAVCFSSILALPAGASAAQSGLTGDPWVDQYIEQVPTASGGKPSSSPRSNRGSGLSRGRVAALADAGGDGFAAVIASAVAQLPATGSQAGSGRPAGGETTAAGSAGSAEAIGAPGAMIDAISGGDGGIGPVLPAVMILSLVGAAAFGFAKARRRHGS